MSNENMVALEGLLSATVEGKLDTAPAPVPVGDYEAVVVHEEGVGDDKKPIQIAIRDFEYTDKDTGATVKGYTAEFPCRIDAPGNEEADRRIVRYKAWLDVVPSAGGSLALDDSKGKNIALGAMFDACDINTDEAHSMLDCANHRIRIHVKHTKSKKAGDDRTFSEADRVAPL